MNEIPSWFIKDWLDTHPGDIFRCCQAILYQENIDTPKKWKFPHVFITKVDNILCVADERDIYNKGLGKFYSHLGWVNTPEVKENYIRVYPVNRLNEYAIFASFFSNADEWTKQQEMPWFEEDKFNKCKFLADIHKTIKSNYE